jgi:hypothetical protein
MTAPVLLRRVALKILTLAFLLLALISTAAQQPGPKISTPEAIKAEFAAVPCKSNQERLASVQALFAKMGASEENAKVEKFKAAENFVLRKPGASAETIIIGAHYDKVSEGCGAVDNWTGIVVVAHLFSALKDMPLQKTVLFVAFGNEEKGLFGSHAMANAIEKTQLPQYCAMINIDSFGLAPPQVLDNTSSRKLTQVAEDLAKEMKIPFAHARVADADADSSSFIERKIPALTLHGLNNNWPEILHSSKDQAARINATSVYLGYRLALALALRTDSAACNAYR